MSIGAGLNRRLTQLAVGQHLPRRTVRVRLTLLYGALFLVSGALLLATNYVFFQRATEYKTPQLPTIPHAPAIRELPHKPAPPQTPTTPAHAPTSSAQPPTGVAKALPRVAQAQYHLAQDQNRLAQSFPLLAKGPDHLVLPLLTQEQHQLTRDQRQLTQAASQLAQAVHQMARAGSAEAAQRAADSHQLLVNSGMALAIVAVLALLAGWLVAGRMLRPIRTITRKAQRISSTNLHERLALDGPQDELKELGDTLDDLFGRLGAAFEAQRNFVANASHELRTPLARQRALIQVALADPHASFTSLRAAHERALASEQHLEQTIDALLMLTRGQAGLERHEALDLAAIASQAMLARKPEAATRDIDVRATLATAPAEGNPRLVERLITNLIDNAIRHNTTGGHAEITTGTRDRHTFLAITNTGPVLPPEEIQVLFQPFQRLGETRTHHNNGHGLGLSIVQAIAAAHRAELIARPRAGGGLTVEVSFRTASGDSPTVTSPLPALNATARTPVRETNRPARS